MSRLGAGGQHMQHFPALVLTSGFYMMAENELWSGLVPARLELEVSTIVRLLDRPSGEDFRNFGDVTLRVAAVHAKRVQFEQFAAVIFVESRALFALCVRVRPWITIRTIAPRTRRYTECLHRVRPDAQPIIKIEQHSRL